MEQEIAAKGKKQQQFNPNGKAKQLLEAISGLKKEEDSLRVQIDRQNALTTSTKLLS